MGQWLTVAPRQRRAKVLLLITWVSAAAAGDEGVELLDVLPEGCGDVASTATTNY